MTLTEIREAIDALPRRGNGKIRGIPQELRREILTQAEINGNGNVGESLGIATSTIYNWARKPKRAVRRRKFRRIAVVPEVREARETSFSVEGPNGLRFIGLTLLDAANLIREVSREF
jgi:hypothetical protein